MLAISLLVSFLAATDLSNEVIDQFCHFQVFGLTELPQNRLAVIACHHDFSELYVVFSTLFEALTLVLGVLLQSFGPTALAGHIGPMPLLLIF